MLQLCLFDLLLVMLAWLLTDLKLFLTDLSSGMMSFVQLRVKNMHLFIPVDLIMPLSLAWIELENVSMLIFYLGGS